MRLIKITAHLMGGIAFQPNEGIALDGLLAWVAVLEREGGGAFEPRTDGELAQLAAEPDPSVPLGVHRQDGLWMYQASLAEVIGYYGTDMRHWNKRFDDAMAQAYIEDIDLSRASTVNTAAGEFKSYHQPIYIEQVKQLVWYAIGDPGEVHRLLATHITHVGKKHNRGYGVVVEWEVEPYDGPEDRWLWRENGEPARTIPTGLLDNWEGEVAWAAYRPPYWLPAHHAWCAVPGPVEAVAR